MLAPLSVGMAPIPVPRAICWNVNDENRFEALRIRVSVFSRAANDCLSTAGVWTGLSGDVDSMVVIDGMGGEGDADSTFTVGAEVEEKDRRRLSTGGGEDGASTRE